MGRFSQYLTDLLPRTGRIIREDGSYINEAESITGANLVEQQTSKIIDRSGQDRRTDTRGTGIFIYPGTTLTVEVDPGGAVNGTFSVAARFMGRH